MFYKRPLFERRVNRDTQNSIKDIFYICKEKIIKNPPFLTGKNFIWLARQSLCFEKAPFLISFDSSPVIVPPQTFHNLPNSYRIKVFSPTSI